MAEKEQEVKEEEYKLVEVPTNHVLAIQTPEGELLSTEQAIVEILNGQRKLLKAL